MTGREYSWGGAGGLQSRKELCALDTEPVLMVDVYFIPKNRCRDQTSD